jgi:hypothetical protein
MARLCPDCGTNLDKFGARHRCHGKVAGTRQPTKLERELIEAGKLDPSILFPKSQPKASAEPLGRLARRPPDVQLAPSTREPQPQLCDILKAVNDLQASFDRLTAAFEALRSTLATMPDKRTDA